MRNPVTYRANRRNDWRKAKKISPVDFPWANFNSYAPKYQLGTMDAKMIVAHVARSKYMPHIGAKQRAKGAAK